VRSKAFPGFINGVNGHVLIWATVCCLVAFVRANYCRIAPQSLLSGSYCVSGYSDIQELFVSRNFYLREFPYSSAANSLEYPPLIGIGNWLISFLVPSTNAQFWFYLINVLIISLLFIRLTAIIKRVQPNYVHLLVLSPAIICTLFVNWDLWVIVPAIIAVTCFEKRHYALSAIWLGVSISTKLFPVVFLLPFLLFLQHNKNYKTFLKFSVITTSTWLVINVPVMLVNFQGWSRFLTLNSERGSDLGSIYFALQLIGFDVPYLNLISAFVGGALFLALALYIKSNIKTVKLSTFVFLSVVIFTTTSKVYSPQFVIWLVPLAILSISSQKDLKSFWLWQISEFLHFIALVAYFEYRADSFGGIFALAYSLAILIRILAISYFAFSQMRQAKIST
jgi:uncharacterized membrane protein